MGEQTTERDEGRIVAIVMMIINTDRLAVLKRGLQ